MSEDDPTGRRPLALIVWAWAAEAPDHLVGFDSIDPHEQSRLRVFVESAAL